MYKEIDQTPYKQEINAKNLIQCWKECMAMSSYALRKAAIEKFNSENCWKKKGLAMVPLKFPVGLGSVAAGQVSSPNRRIKRCWGNFLLRWISHMVAISNCSTSPKLCSVQLVFLQRRQELLCPLPQGWWQAFSLGNWETQHLLLALELNSWISSLWAHIT